MPDADDALRSEIEKVRERSRLQALAQGLPPDEADRRGQQSVDDFCSKWGIRPEMVAPPRAARPPAAPARAVDLGSSPLRSSNPSSTQAIRIADLMKRGNPGTSPPSPVSPGAGGKSGLAGLLDKVRSQSFPDAGTAPPPPAARPPSGTSSVASSAYGGRAASGSSTGAYAAYRSQAAAPPPQAPPPPPARATAPAGGAYPISQPPPSSASADRRRDLLEEFDRTYAEVQAMLEQRIGVADIALNDGPKGLASAFDRAAAAGLGSAEAQVLAGDVQRLRDHLQQMTGICEEFLSHLDEFVGRSSGGGQP